MMSEEKKKQFANLIMEEYDLRPSVAYDYTNRFFRWLEEKGPIRLTIDEEVRIINEIVVQAVLHGGDNGGPYYSNTVSLYKILKSWLTEKEYADDYKIVLDRYIDCDRRETYENMFAIVPKDNKTEEYHIPKSDFAF